MSSDGSERDRLLAEIEALGSAARVQTREIVRLTLENRRQRCALETAERARLALAAHVLPLHAAHERIAHLEARSGAQAERARAREAALEAQLAEMARSVAAISSALDAVRASSSWRLMRPWRFMGRLVRRARVAGT